MPRSEEILRSLVKQWLAKADVDYRTAESLLRDPQPIRESVAFHCQQASEKWLKALLVSRQVEFPKTHSIGRLLDLLAGIEPQLAAALEDTDVLTLFGVELRYPGDFPEMLPGQEKELFGLAQRTRDSVLRLLGPSYR